MSVDIIYMPPFEFQDVTTPEFLRCACTSCGYIWAEEPGLEKKKK
jgi:hypothetical protein